MRKVVVGKVVSNKMDKTIVVAVEDSVKHKLYNKIEPPHISPLFNHQKQSKVTFAIRCTNQKHLYLYTSATYALFSNILPEKACFLLRIFVSLHRQSKEQPSCAKSRSSMTTEAGLNRWQAPVINEDHKMGRKRLSGEL